MVELSLNQSNTTHNKLFGIRCSGGQTLLFSLLFLMPTFTLGTGAAVAIWRGREAERPAGGGGVGRIWGQAEPHFIAKNQYKPLCSSFELLNISIHEVSTGVIIFSYLIFCLFLEKQYAISSLFLSTFDGKKYASLPPLQCGKCAFHTVQYRELHIFPLC